MEFPDLHRFSNKELLSAGKVLIAQPFMSDSTFSRSVVLLCEYSKEGALGFVLNQPTNVNINDVLPEFPSPDLPISHGGPVQLDTLHIIHKSPMVLGGTEVDKGVYWGATLDALQDFINDESFTESSLRLFVGYSGWSPGQLENELKEGSWLITNLADNMVFNTDPDDLWKNAIYSLGNEYRYIANLPVDPSLN